MKKFSPRPMLTYLMVVILLFIGLSSKGGTNRADELVYSDVRTLLEEHQVRELRVEDDVLTLRLWTPQADGTETLTYRIYSFPMFYDDLNDLIVEEWRMGRPLRKFRRIFYGLRSMQRLAVPFHKEASTRPKWQKD